MGILQQNVLSRPNFIHYIKTNHNPNHLIAIHIDFGWKKNLEKKTETAGMPKIAFSAGQLPSLFVNLTYFA